MFSKNMHKWRRSRIKQKNGLNNNILITDSRELIRLPKTEQKFIVWNAYALVLIKISGYGDISCGLN